MPQGPFLCDFSLPSLLRDYGPGRYRLSEARKIGKRTRKMLRTAGGFSTQVLSARVS